MRWSLAVLTSAVLLIAAAPAGGQGGSCVPRASKDRGDAATLKRAQKIVKKYAFETIDSCNGVEGMGVGAADGVTTPDPKAREHVVVIYLRDRASRPKRAKSIAGVTIRYVVTGEFQAL
jgi:hypothetical protein